MPAVFLVADFIITDAFATAGIADAIAGAVGGGLLGSVTTGAVIGAVGGAAGAAIEGGNIWKGAEMGALGGGIGAGVTSELVGTAGINDPNALGGPVTTTPTTGLFGTQGAYNPLSAATTASLGQTALAQGLGSAIGGFATTGNVKSALESGGISGLVNYAFPTGGLSGSSKDLAQLEQGLTSTALRDLLAPGLKQANETGGAFGGGLTDTRTSPGPSSSALAQVLNTGGPVFGAASGDEEKSKPGAWNVESLRYMGSDNG